MSNTTIRVSPDVCSYITEDGEGLTIEISLPGVNKEDITLKLNEDSLYLSAPRDDIKYVATMATCCQIVPDKANATYENGLLVIKVPFKDTMEYAKKITIK